MWADKMIIEYKKGISNLKEMSKNLTDSELDQLDKTQINSMVGDMTYAINWLKIGKEPGALRGIDRRSIYQRRALMDMDLFPSLEIEPEREELSNENKEAIVNILVHLSERERQCFVLHGAYEMSMADIGKEIGISKSAVQKYIDRAKNKIKNKIVSYDCHTLAT